MRSLLLVVADLASAVVSKRIALQIHAETKSRAEREQLCIAVCRDLEMPGYAVAGRVLEYFSFACRTTTHEFGSWDSGRVLIERLGLSSRHALERIVSKLVNAGLLETFRGRPDRKKRGSCNFYRLTTGFAKAFKKAAAVLRQAASSLQCAVPRNVKALATFIIKKTDRLRKFREQNPEKFSDRPSVDGRDRTEGWYALAGLKKSLTKNR